ncbi:integrin alpha-5 isoform X2 [Procambarus clarkii]|uniref:integrin alpha-5 isoform X2 n=1 Tax=Procambarus clarkii TaxID=6728 RepID=UPI0037448AC1
MASSVDELDPRRWLLWEAFHVQFPRARFPGKRMLHLVIVLWLATRAALFNMDATRPLVLTGNKKSQFGFSVAIWPNFGEPLLVVGAPQDAGGASVGEDEGQSKVRIIPGTVYLCDPINNFSCSTHRTKFQPRYHGDVKRDLTRHGNGSYSMGFGSTVLAGSSTASPLLMCAPRASYFFRRGTHHSVIPEGQCLLLPAGAHSPLRLRPNTTDVRYCGFSAAFGKDERVVYLGCPSTLDQNTGHVLRFDLDDDLLPEERSLSRECGGAPYEAWAMTTTLKGSKDLVVTTSCSSRGHVVELTTLGRREGAGGVGELLEEGAGGVGELLEEGAGGVGELLEEGAGGVGELLEEGAGGVGELLEEGAGGVGEMLGAALEACDLDGDGEDEVVVGAPLGRVPLSSGYKETGKVLVIVPKHGVTHTLEGTEDFAWFGNSLACLGDINNDGYKDLAVGAPQHSGGGAVFIFLGSNTGIRATPSQPTPKFSLSGGFGYSLAGGRDGDGNGYPDLLVGAPLSDAAFFFRTAPVLRLHVWSFEFSVKQVDLQERTCLEQGETWARRVCFHLRVQLRVVGGPDRFEIELAVRVVLDAGQPRQRVFFKDFVTQVAETTIRLKNRIYQHEYQVYAEDLASEDDAVATSVANVQVRLIQVHQRESGELLPVVEDPEKTDNTSVRLSCGNDTSSCVATTDVKLSLDNDTVPFLVGMETVEVRASLKVETNTAFEPTLEIGKADGLLLQECRTEDTNVTFDCKSNGICSASRSKLRAGHQFDIVVVWKQEVAELLNSTQTHEDPGIRSRLSVRVINQESDPSNNHAVFTLLPQVAPAFTLYGRSEPETLSYNTTGIPEEALPGNQGLPHQLSNHEDLGLAELGPTELSSTVNHTFTLTNLGLTVLLRTRVDIYWPVRNRTAEAPFSRLKGAPTLTVPPGATYQCHTLLQSPSGTSLGPPEGDTDGPVVSCHSFECSLYRCEVSNVRREGKVTIHLEAVIIPDALKGMSGTVRLESWCRAEVESPSRSLVAGTLLVQTMVLGTLLALPQEVPSTPVWVLVLASLGGLLLLATLVAGLYKVGFFKRIRPPKQPLEDPQIINKE